MEIYDNGRNKLKKIIIPILITATVTLSGCAVQNDTTRFHGLGLTYQSNIQKLENGDNFVEVEAALAAGRTSGAIGAANTKASDFCRSQGKSMKEVKMETDSHLLVNGVARLTFRCL